MNLPQSNYVWPLLMGVLVMSVSAGAEPPGLAEPVTEWGRWERWGDQGDGTYRNPILPADYSDIDCIRVGSDYYAISSTFQYSPGMVVLHSRDLVNWRIIGHAVADLSQIGPELNWDRMNRYGRGIWAGAIRYHRGKFRVYFGTPDEGYFMTTAEDPAGPWAPLHQMKAEEGWDDCCPFWDDDGQGYFVGTHFKDGYKTYLYRLTEDGRDLVPESRILINEGRYREANKLYKIDGIYYHFFSEHVPGVGRYVMMQRAKSILGPYSEPRQLSHAQREFREPNQGGLVQTEAGEWFFFTHHGTGAWEGRCASLLPVEWREGWPILGKPAEDGIGRMVWGGRKPVHGQAITGPQTDDDFDRPRLGVQWEWNYQPRGDKWSLSERPGHLRLHAFPPLRKNDIRAVGNVLTQRVHRTNGNQATVELDLTGMVEGQAAGLCLYARDFATIGVRHREGRLVIESARGVEAITEVGELASRRLWLRASWGLEGRARLAFSKNGNDFQVVGEDYQLGWAFYRGSRIGVFTFNDEGEAGWVDVASFRYQYR